MHEIIHVVDAAGIAAQDLEIHAAQDRRLTPGYYFVLWPKKAAAKRRGKRCFGPLRTLAQACLLMTSAQAFGLADDQRPRPATAECRSIVRNATAANSERFPPPARQRRGAP